MNTNLKVLIGKLDDVCRKATERAINACMARGQYEVDLEHLFLALLEDTHSDFFLLCRHYGISAAILEKDLCVEIARFRSGNSRTPAFSEYVQKVFEQAWLLASLDSRAPRICSGHLLLALLTEPALSQLAHRSSAELGKFAVDELRHRLAELTAEFPEACAQGALACQGAVITPERASAAIAPDADARTPALDQYTTDLTGRARSGGIDPVIGRDAEIRQMIDILMRRRQNNPILTGDAGVGKTAVVEGLALRIVCGDVPAPLRDVALHVLDLGLLQAGASVKGEFENRLRMVIEEVRRSARPVILFIDEAHTLIGAGGQAGQNDAANLLKPALARGELRTIAATTWGEYKKYFEKDAALARRFQVVKIEEPTEEVACAMLRGIAGHMERHFGVRVLDESIVEAVRLSARYISGRQLPDKAIGVLDTACARVALGLASTPAAIEDARKRDAALALQITALEKEQAAGGAHREKLTELLQEKAVLHARLASDEAQWERERALVVQIRDLRARLEASLPEPLPMLATGTEDGTPVGACNSAPSSGARDLTRLQKELALLQGDAPLVPACVDRQAIGAVVSAWTGIPLGKMVKDEIRTVLTLQDLLARRVLGQPHAIAEVARAVRTARAGIEEPGKPRGVFLFVGPSGVGKTETALALADALYGGERSLITINMSEYQEAHTVAGLKGSPPGYVGYGEGGVLTEAVRRKPYSVLLLDEVEKAHPDVLELFFQVFDKGTLDDAEGRAVDFRNTIIILTSNAASASIMQSCLNTEQAEMPDPEALAASIRPTLYKIFKPAFLGRVKVIPYYPLGDDILADVVRLKLDRICKRVEATYQASVSCADEVVESVLARCTEVDSGARNIDHILAGTILPEIASCVLARVAEGEQVRRLTIEVDSASRFNCRAG